jgi:Spy/CpxP family protein refolding chaperone
MNRWIRNTLVSASLLGALALPATVAFAFDGSQADAGHHGRHGREGGLLRAALRVDSLTADQRTSIEKLLSDHRAAEGPVRAADAQFLTTLAQQVERASIDPQALAPSLAAEQSAASAEAASERGMLTQLHSILTSAQRGQLVDHITAKGEHPHEHSHDGDAGSKAHTWMARSLDLTPGQQAQIRANLAAEASTGSPHGNRAALLQAFRGDTFDATAFVTPHSPGARMERFASAAVPVLTPAQRATLADHLRQRAAHESKGA